MSRMNYDFVDVERSRISTTAMPQWLPDDRNNIMHVSYSDRATVRDCPMNRPGRSLRESELENAPSPPVRRRIGLAVSLFEITPRPLSVLMQIPLQIAYGLTDTVC
jgi:hypothetical protein